MARKKASALAGVWEPAAEEFGGLRPHVVIPMCEVPAGKMPRGAAGVVKLALAAGLEVWSTYAMAFVPGARRKVAEAAKVPAGEVEVKATFERITITLETVAVRLWLADESRRAWATWHNGNFEQAWARDVTTHQLNSGDLRAWIEASKMSV